MKPLFLTLILLVLLNSSCKKEVDKLPPAIQTGANTFGCLIDGKAWVPTGSGGLFVSIYPTSGGFFVDAAGTLNVFIEAYSGNDNIDIYLKYATALDTYSLNKSTLVKPTTIFPESYGAY